MPLYHINGKLVLFIHIPKTGGTSVDFWLRSLGEPILGSIGQEVDWLPCVPQHLHAEPLSQLVPHTAPDYAFAIVRHPEHRMVSEFFHRHKTKKTRRLGRHLRSRPFEQLSEAQMSRYFEAWQARCFKKYQRHPFWDSNHVRPQSAFTDWPGLHVFRYEDGLQKVYDAVTQKLGLGATGEVPRLNSSKKHSLVLTDKAKARIRSFYARDYENWYA